MIRIQRINTARAVLAILAATGVIAATGPRADADGTVLFSSDAPLNITIEGPFDTLVRTAETDPDYHAGTLTLTSDGAPLEVFPIRVRARGVTRRNSDICRFPPLRINFDRSARPLAATVFEGQNRLKLVTHCQTSERYQQYYVLEYLAYRIYNELTPLSFRARPLNVTYRDTDGRRADVARFAFFIEDVDDAAERNGYEEFDVEGGVPDSRLNGEHAALGSLFQYMIGNLDWDFAQGPADEDCCHNSRLANSPAMTTNLAPLPYDFDFSGFVDAPYAYPPAQFNMRNVTTRRYRGRCQYNAGLAAAAARFQERRNAIFAIVENEPRLNTRTRRRAVRYLEGFYDIIGDAGRFDRNVVRACT